MTDEEFGELRSAIYDAINPRTATELVAQMSQEHPWTTYWVLDVPPDQMARRIREALNGH